VLRDVEVQDAPTVVTDGEEAVEHTEGDGWNREEIDRGNGFSVVAKKRKPALGWLRIPRRSFHPAGDRSLRDIKTKHQELAMDARRSPGRIFGDHPEDQLPNPSKLVSSLLVFGPGRSNASRSGSLPDASEPPSPV
jgi:hypothetical protein